MYVVGEDGLSCALGVRLASDVLRQSLAQPPIDTKGVTKLVPALPRYAQLAARKPVLCIADTDGKCAKELIAAWRPRGAPQRLIVRLAVVEAESWLLADADDFATFLGVAQNRIPRQPDDVADPKRLVCELARRSRNKPIRQEVVSPIGSVRPGVGYNFHLRDFAMRHWQPRRAAERSPSLARAVRQLDDIRSLL